MDLSNFRPSQIWHEVIIWLGLCERHAPIEIHARPSQKLFAPPPTDIRLKVQLIRPSNKLSAAKEVQPVGKGYREERE